VHYYGYQIKDDKTAGHVTGMLETSYAYSILVRKPEEKKPLGRPRRRWQVSITM